VPDVSGEKRDLVSQLRAVIRAKDEQLASLTASLEAAVSRLQSAAREAREARERERRLEPRVAELERRLSMDSSDSGTPSSREGIGAKAERKAREKKGRGQLAVDTPVSPSRVVPGHFQDQRPHGRRGPGPSRTAARIRPAPPDEAGVPAQQGPRRDDQAQLTQVATGQQPGSADRTARSAQDRHGAWTWRCSTAT
jgi:hypothetical protein